MYGISLTKIKQKLNKRICIEFKKMESGNFIITN